MTAFLNSLRANLNLDVDSQAWTFLHFCNRVPKQNLQLVRSLTVWQHRPRVHPPLFYEYGQRELEFPPNDSRTWIKFWDAISQNLTGLRDIELHLTDDLCDWSEPRNWTLPLRQIRANRCNVYITSDIPDDLEDDLESWERKLQRMADVKELLQSEITSGGAAKEALRYATKARLREWFRRHCINWARARDDF